MDFGTAIKILGIIVILIGLGLCLPLLRALYSSPIYYKRESDSTRKGNSIPEQSGQYSTVAPRAPISGAGFPISGGY